MATTMTPSTIPIGFATAMVILLIYLSSSSSSTHVEAQRCGRQASGARCPNNICCSQFGWCGTTNAYCVAGCQSDCLQCGHKRGGLICPGDRCCSQFGYCGVGRAYCCSGCQSNCRPCAASATNDNTTLFLNYLLEHENQTVVDIP